MTVTFTQLESGISIHLKEIHTAPIISHWVWYRVGSRNEQPGKTGISHWVEHMQFKGTQKYPNGVLDKMISREGGIWNAFTNLDWTAYYQVMPADKIDIALQLEADRMQNSLYNPQEVEAERTVILSELEGSENEPLFRLTSAVQAAAFDIHPYRHEIIGEKQDLLSISRDELYRYYRQHYSPANALVAVAGDFDTREMLARLTDLYAQIPAADLPDVRLMPEPEPAAEKRVELSGAGDATYLQLAYRSPAGWHRDFHALNVLDSLLTGPSHLSMYGGGGLSNRTSRLYRALVEKRYAVAVHGSLQATIDPYLYTILVVLHPDKTPEELLRALDEQIETLQDTPVPVSEIERAIKQAKALFAYNSESITNQAFWLGYAPMFAGYDWFINYISALEQTTPLDLQEAARHYLNPSRRVVGIYRSTGDGGGI